MSLWWGLMGWGWIGRKGGLASRGSWVDRIPLGGGMCDWAGNGLFGLQWPMFG